MDVLQTRVKKGFLGLKKEENSKLRIQFQINFGIWGYIELNTL
jgi:hypothetical protein